MGVPDFLPADALEWRRFRAFSLAQHGLSRRDIAEAGGASQTTVSRWLARARHGGPEALRARPSPGAPPKLPAAHKALIPEFLWHGAEAYGFRGGVWTCARIAQVIEGEFGVRPRKGNVGKLPRELRWAPQVPSRRALQGDEEAIRRWRTEAWPELRRRARRERRALVFVGESGAYLLPGLARTYAPEAHTAVLRGAADARPPVGDGRDGARGQGLDAGARSRSTACTRSNSRRTCGTWPGRGCW
jgi:transposase